MRLASESRLPRLSQPGVLMKTSKAGCSQCSLMVTKVLLDRSLICRRSYPTGARARFFGLAPQVRLVVIIFGKQMGVKGSLAGSNHFTAHRCCSAGCRVAAVFKDYPFTGTGDVDGQVPLQPNSHASAKAAAISYSSRAAGEINGLRNAVIHKIACSAAIACRTKFLTTDIT